MTRTYISQRTRKLAGTAAGAAAQPPCKSGSANLDKPVASELVCEQ
jgi:hypothetical protein